MKARRWDLVRVLVGGQIAIPHRLCKKFNVVSGTRVVIYPDGDKIVLLPMAHKFYRSVRGSLKGTSAMKVFTTERKRG